MLKSCWNTLVRQRGTSLKFMSTSSAEIIRSSENPGPIEVGIIEKLKESLNPSYVKVANDSAKHAHHAGIRGAENVTESHFRIEIISEEFSGKALPARHRLVYHILENELKTKGVHALQLKTKTPQEMAMK